MIFRRGEYLRILSGSWDKLGEEIKEQLVGKYGQIHKIGDLDNDEWPYIVVTVLDDGSTYKFPACQKELLLLEFRQAEVELSEYLKKVKR